jgi:tetratricopeptide (TPR) repeat protein
MAQAFEQPARVGPFEITGTLGEGGMGIVYSARSARGERVAVKTVPAVETTFLAVLRREIHALGRLAHPGVVRVIASGVEGGRPWYAMELLEGTTIAALRDSLWGDVLGLMHTHVSGGGSDAAPTLAVVKEPEAAAEAIASAPPPRLEVAGGQLARVLAIVRRLLGTLAFVHGEGIVHRDLKPSNIFLRTGDEPVLFDFGLAWRSAGAVGREVVDEGLDVVGTPAYMAPEQIRSDLVDSRADLYALGCLLYELLTGRPPFTGAATVVMAHHLTMAPVPPSALVEGCPPALDALVLSLLEKRPRDRLGNALDAIYALDALGILPPALHPPPRGRATVYRPALAGRDAALELVARAAETAIDGRGGVVLIAGESGLGKTYLAMEASRRATEFQLIAGTCAPVGEPLAPLARLFDAIVDRCTAGGLPETERVLGAAGKVLAAHAPALADLPGQAAHADPSVLHGPAARDRLLAALAGVVAVMAASKPLLLVLDDLQWADELTTRFLSALADDWFAGKRVLVLGTYRVEEATAALAELGARPYAREVRLAKLDAPIVRSLICDMLAVDAPPAAFVSFLARHSDGNPFFVAEYLRTATAEGLIRRTEQRRLRLGADGARDDDADALHLPLTMRELIARRLDGLSAIARTLAACGSVLGRELDADVLRDAARVDDNAAMEAAAELIARQVLEPTETGGLRFVHDKLWEVAYERQDDGERRARHAAAAAAIEARWAEPERARHYAALAHHYLTAGLEAKAIDYLDKAGDRALDAALYTEAIDHYRKLLAIDDRRGNADARRRARWERRLGEARFNLGDLAGCEEASLAAMRRLGRDTPSTRRGWLSGLARMTGIQALHRFGRGTGAVSDADQRDDLREVALAASTMAWRYFFVDDMIGVVSMSLLSVNEIEAAQPPIAVASPYAWLGYTAGFARLHGQARYYFDRAYDAAREAGDVAGGHFASLMESLYHVGFAHWTEAERINRGALAALEHTGDPTNAEHHGTMLANALFYVGRFDESIRGFEQVLRTARARRNLQHVAWGLYAGCKGMVAQGRFDEALPRLAEARAVLDTLEDSASQIITSGLETLAHVRRGDHDAARAAADDTTRRLRSSRAVVYSTVLGYLGCAEGYLELAAHDRSLMPTAARAVSDLRTFALLFPFAGPAYARYRAQLHALTGHPRRARRGFERAVALSRRLAMPYDEAQALWLASRYGDPRRAVDAARIFERLGCRWHLAQIRT